jgi:uncharacterized membrane protein YvlD (DUF360 family)
VTFKRCVCVVLLAALLAVFVRPAPAEALEPTTIMLIAGVGIAVIAVVAVLIIANVTEKRPRTSQIIEALAAPPLLALPTPVNESP